MKKNQYISPAIIAKYTVTEILLGSSPNKVDEDDDDIIMDPGGQEEGDGDDAAVKEWNDVDWGLW